MISRLNILYHSLLSKLDDYTTVLPGFQAYYDQQVPGKQERLFELVENISTRKAEIEGSRDAGVAHSEFQTVSKALSDLSKEFPDYPAGVINGLLFMMKIFDQIQTEIASSGAAFDLAVMVDENLFCLEQITRFLESKNFWFEDTINLENSIFLFDLSDFDQLESAINQHPVSIELLFHLLARLGLAGAIAGNNKYVLIRASQQGQHEAVFSCVALHLVKAGKLVHHPSNYLSPPTIHPSRVIRSNEGYQQFIDSIGILSEYNSQHDILDKYLRLYHLIEHFMFRKPIVELELRRNNLPFSIRDFRTLYKNVEQKEEDAIRLLLRAVLNLDITPGTTFISNIYSEWQNLVTNHGMNTIHSNRLFDSLGLGGINGFLYNTITADRLAEIYHKIVYAFRNSIVHNKATEFHLDHEALTNHHYFGNVAQIIIQHFLLPSMEQISYYLIIERNPLVWYRNPHFVLFNN